MFMAVVKLVQLAESTMLSRLLILLLFIFACGVNSYHNYHHHNGYNENKSDNLLIKAPMGTFQGSIMKTILGKNIFAFRGIRYAEPPVGNLRFQPPLPINKYKGIYNATADGAVCPQPNAEPISEDCLFLNVFSTKLPSFENVKRPVIIHFHSGGFYAGGERSDWYGPQYFMDRDIVLVTLNYRLGSLGFISTGDRHAPGNNGLKDQVVAMKWVNKNIESFGGDPNSVTIMGYSAGSWSVALHMVSPMSKGLFHKAVASSGSPLGIYDIPKHQLDIAKKQARILNCPDDTSENIIACLKTKTAEELGNSLPGFYEFSTNPILIWSMNIEEDFGQDRFLPDHPINLINKGGLMNVPLMAGVTSDEFVYPAILLYSNQTLLEELENNWEKLAPICFSYERDTEKSKLVSRGIKEFYFGNRSLTNTTSTALEKVFGDTTGYGVNRLVKLYSQKRTQPTYYYRFAFQGRYSFTYLPNTTVPAGVVHHDDLIYTFYIPIFPYFNVTDPEFPMVTKLTTIFENFAKTGNPTPNEDKVLDDIKWTPFTVENQNYLDINKLLKMEKDLYKERYDFWEGLYPVDKI